MSKQLIAELVQAGSEEGDDMATVTFRVSRDQLRGWPLPFYRESVVTVEDAPPADPLASHPELPLS